MVKRKNRSKRSLVSLPKGLPVRDKTTTNPFETARVHNKRPKQQVVNRQRAQPTTNHAAATPPTALARALSSRQDALRERLKTDRKANQFVDGRIGVASQMTADERNLARLVRERSRRSKRSTKYQLDDSNDAELTHKGRAIDAQTAKEHVILSDDDEPDTGNLDALDTELHFGGGGAANARKLDPYGRNDQSNTMADAYTSRKTELDDLILRRKLQKAERLKNREDQMETFEAMDESFAELSGLLSFRDKEKNIRDHLQAKRAGTLSKEDQEMADWDKEMKQFAFLERKVQATDQTKTPEELAMEEAERLHELETRRLARMNGDFDNDGFSDISDDDVPDRKKRKHKRARNEGPEALDDSDDEDVSDHELQTRFTSEGLVQVDKDSTIVKKLGQEENTQSDSSSVQYKVGTRVTASYRANEQFDGHESWFPGTISAVNQTAKGITYTVDYDDGDFEEHVEPRHVRPQDKSQDELEKEKQQKAKEIALKAKHQKAREKARTDLPFVFEVPTTLDALHDMIANYASTGTEASLIIQRIYAANTVRLDKRNREKMQNFYDVLLRRFVAVGDAIYESGDGGKELGRFQQLDVLTQTMYSMAQDSAESAGAVWGRRLGIFQNAHAKRLRDAELERDDEEEEDFTAWPSTGLFLTLRALGHIFPVTDLRHHVVTPAILLLGQMIAQTPVLSKYDVVMGILCSGLLLEYTRDAKRVAPESHAFFASVVRLFACDEAERLGSYSLPSLCAAAKTDEFASFRSTVVSFKGKDAPRLSLEKVAMEKHDMPVALLFAALDLIETSVKNLSRNVSSAEKELFAEITNSLLALAPTRKSSPLPKAIQTKAAAVARALSEACQLEEPRLPVQRRAGPTVQERAIKTLAPRLENPEKYSYSKDKGKSSMQAAMDRTRREYKREHKAVARELRLDGAFIETERRQEQHKKDSAAKAKRQKNFAWLESEQATMNQQVAQGGELLKGGGTGAARAKAASAKMGIKKGGKF